MLRIFDQYVSRKTLFLVLGDAFWITLSIIIGYRIRFWNDDEGFQFYTQFPDIAIRCAVVIAVFQVCAYYNELYRVEERLSTSDQFFRIAQATGVGCFLLAAVYFAAPQLSIGRTVFALTLALALATTTLFRALTDHTWNTALPKRRVLIMGTDSVAAGLGREVQLRDDLGMQLAGFVATKPDAASNLPAEIVGVPEEIEHLVAEHAVRAVLVAEEPGVAAPAEALLRLRTRGIQIEDARASLAGLTGKISMDTVRSTWFVFSAGFTRSQYGKAFKRISDLGLALVGLTLSLPVMAIVAVVVRLDSPGPILFRQRRTGLNGRVFEVLKFRTMRQDAEEDGVARWAEQDDPRITRCGKYLRLYRFDELPQYINVIRGDMSFVGPRPERPEFVSQIRQVEPLYDERHTVRPGITGWAQVCYPYGSSLEDAVRKLEYDLFYLKNVSVLFDMAIVFQTVKIILWGRGR